MRRFGSIRLNHSPTAPQRAAHPPRQHCAALNIRPKASGSTHSCPETMLRPFNRAAAREHTTSWSQPGFIPLALMIARAGGLIRYATNSLAAPGSLLSVATWLAFCLFTVLARIEDTRALSLGSMWERKLIPTLCENSPTGRK